MSSPLPQLLHDNYDDQNHELTLFDCHHEIWKKILLSAGPDGGWHQLRVFSLIGCEIDQYGAQILSNMQWPNLHTFQIGGTIITTPAIPTILKSLPKLTKLALWDNKMDDHTIEHIASNRNLKAIQGLNLSCNLITWRGIMGVGFGGFGELRRLCLYRNYRIGSSGIKVLVKGHFPQLQHLYIGQCRLGDEGVTHLSKGNWPNLKHLKIQQNQMCLLGCESLMHNNWKKLKKLMLGYFLSSFTANDAIMVLSTVAAQWSGNLEMHYAITKNQIMEDIKSIAESRYGIGKEEEEEEDE